MLFDQFCTAFDSQPRKLLWAGHILPSCLPAPTLQPWTCVPHCSALQQSFVPPVLAGYPQIYLQGTHWWIIVWSHPLCFPCHVQRSTRGFPRWDPAGKLERKLHTSNCMPKETLHKVVENIFHVFYLPHESVEVAPKTSGSCWEKTTALNR